MKNIKIKGGYSLKVQYVSNLMKFEKY